MLFELFVMSSLFGIVALVFVLDFVETITNKNRNEY